jgi:hypothetical protein
MRRYGRPVWQPGRLAEAEAEGWNARALTHYVKYHILWDEARGA